jgi:uncharacterized membrane protein
MLYVLRCYMSCDVICLAMLYVLRCYMSCDVICLAMLYVYIKTQTTKNKKQKQKKPKKRRQNFFFFYIYILSLISLFCHSFLGFLYNPIKRRVNDIQIKVRESPGKPGLHSIVSVNYN